MEKYKRIFNTLRLADNQFNAEDIIGVFLYGSQNYNLDRENSDIDIKVITLPSLDTITKSTNPYSKEKELFDKNGIALGKMDIKEIRKMTDMYKKQNINFIETLFTDYYILNPSYEHIFKEYFINNREEIAYYDMSKAIISSGYQALSTLDVKNPSGKVFVNAPDAIEGNRVEKCDTSAAEFQSENTGIIDGIGTEDEIIAQMRALVSVLPSNNESDVYTDTCEDDLNRVCNSMAEMKGDPRYLLSEISDGHVFIETKADYAKNMVTGLIKLNGMTVGAVANCSEVYDEEGKKAETFDLSLTARGCDKAAEFIQFCDAFNIPVLSITNVNGYKNCMCAEKRLAKALARMTYAFANATVPKVNLVTGEAYGSAYVAMNSKSIGADMVYAYPDAKIGAMDSKLAVKIMYPEANAKELEDKASEYESLQSSVSAAAARGYVDLIIEPADTRKYLVAAFELLYTKCAYEPDKKHGTK